MQRYVAALALLVAASPLAAQRAGANGKPLTPDALDQWQSITGERLSDDGRWLAYTLVPQVGEGTVVVRAVDGGTEYRHTRGYIGRPQTRAGASRGPAFPVQPARFFGASHVLFLIEPPQDSVEQARRQKKKPADQPKSSLGIMRLSDGAVTVVPRVKAVEPPRGEARHAVYLMHGADSAETKPDTGAARAAATPGGEPRPVADSAAKRKPKKKDYGAPLVIRDLATGAETRVDDVLSVETSEDGAWVAYVVSSRDSTRDGVFLRRLSDGTTRAVLAGVGRHKALAFDSAGRTLAFVTDVAEASADKPRYALHLANVAAGTSRAVVTPASHGDSLVVSDRGRLEFSPDGARLQFGLTTPPLDSIPADSLADKAVFDLWHWKEPRLQPQQQVEAERDRGRAIPAVLDVRTGRHRVIGADSISTLRFGRDLRSAIALVSEPYAVQAMWGEGGSDVYLVNTATGRLAKVGDRLPFGASLSPASRYALYFGRDGHWHAYAAATGKSVNITAPVTGVRFDQETWDTPSDPAPWGIAGWTPDDRSVLVYDRYDIWELDPAGTRAPRAVTDSLGRQRRIVFRHVPLDTAAQFIDPKAPMMLSAFNERTKASGAWQDRVDGTQRPDSLYMADKRFGRPTKAANADRLLFEASTFREFPDLWVSDLTMRNAQKLTSANPQQAEYRWGTAQLVSWRSLDGVPLQGVLYKPDGFDPSKQYPMVVYFYEQLSDNLHAHQVSYPRNTIQPTHYVSHGYLVFFPDIAYTEGYPGPSAVNSILPGVQMLVDSGFVKPDGIGIAGQSWGGYQVAHIITRSNLFKAAFAGAPVANMTSAYGGIRWESGLARAFQYEKTQSRIGGSLWDRPMRYLENSPLFHADRIETPLFIMHNDADGAVPWYQGIEMFVAMRRLGKEVYLINYNGDAHNPTKRANQKDMAVRMMQFFDHHLRGAPAPKWMQEGIPFLQKGRMVEEEIITEEGNGVSGEAPGGR